MRRQTQSQGLATRWPARPLDVDPFQLPARFALVVQGSSGGSRPARDHITISRNAVAVEHEVLGAVTAAETIAAEAFAGVAVRAEALPEGDDAFAISVNLHHADPRLCIPLHVSFDMDDVGARWQSWARALGLPLLLPALDGSWREPVTRLGALVVGAPCRRDPRLALGGRRSLTASLREVGVWRELERIVGAEIIARN